MTQRFADRVAIVTGGARGIGRAIALTLAREGANVVVTRNAGDRASSQVGTAEETAEQIEALGRGARVVGVDVRRPEDTRNLVKETLSAFGRVDVLVNNAAATDVKPKAFHEWPVEDCDYQIDASLNGVMHCCRAVIPAMMEQGSGNIVNITSTAAKTNLAPLAVYAAAKAGVAHFSRNLARELASAGIRVNSLAPGMIETETLFALGEGLLEMAKMGIPMGRFGEPDEIARTVAFLASDDSSYITGQHLSVDGGIGPY